MNRSLALLHWSIRRLKAEGLGVRGTSLNLVIIRALFWHAGVHRDHGCVPRSAAVPESQTSGANHEVATRFQRPGTVFPIEMCITNGKADTILSWRLTDHGQPPMVVVQGKRFQTAE